jgi:hypothetical protein
MFLSDQLVEAGLDANPKNNRSMSIAEEQLVAKCKAASASMTPKQIKNAVGYACDSLHRTGFPYYNAERITSASL